MTDEEFIKVEGRVTEISRSMARAIPGDAEPYIVALAIGRLTGSFIAAGTTDHATAEEMVEKIATYAFTHAFHCIADTSEEALH